MDDVLASIRRIVRSEKEPDDVAPADAGDPAPDMPLELTPDMRTDAEKAEDLLQEASQPMESAPPEAPLAENPVADAPVAGAPQGGIAQPQTSFDPDPIPDDSQIKDMIREVLREEIAGDQLGEAVRGIIREELMTGEIGANISQNVMALIQAEVASAIGK